MIILKESNILYQLVIFHQSAIFDKSVAFNVIIEYFNTDNATSENFFIHVKKNCISDKNVRLPQSPRVGST